MQNIIKINLFHRFFWYNYSVLLRFIFIFWPSMKQKMLASEARRHINLDRVTPKFIALPLSYYILVFENGTGTGFFRRRLFSFFFIIRKDKNPNQIRPRSMAVMDMLVRVSFKVASLFTASITSNLVKRKGHEISWHFGYKFFFLNSSTYFLKVKGNRMLFSCIVA